jgi:tetratricopeptide (TPR) repeat protein
MRFTQAFNKKTLLVLVLLSVFALYAGVLKAQFTNWDDDVHLYENVSVLSLDLEHRERIFTEKINKIYIPLTTLSFAVEHHFFGFNPFVYHLDNLLLHLANVLLVYCLASRLGLSAAAAVLAALLFGIHPMRVESVAWITERKDVLYAHFYLWALLSYLRYIDRQKQSPQQKVNAVLDLITVTVFGVLSMLAKPMALSLPLILCLLDWFNGRKISFHLLREKIFLIIAIAAIVLISYVEHARIPGDSGILQAVLIWVWSLVFYLRQYAFPFFSAAIFELPQPVSLMNPQYLLSFVSLVAVIVMLACLRKSRWLIFAFGYFFFSIFFILRFDATADTNIVADRFMYLSGLGFTLLLGYVFDWLNNYQVKMAFIKNLRPAVYALGLLMIAGYSFKVLQFVRVWNNSVELWRHELKINPNSHTAYNSLANALSDQEDFRRAKEDYRRLIKLQAEGAVQKIPPALINSVKRVEYLRWLYEKSIAAKPDFFRAHFNLGKFYEETGMLKQAFESYLKAIEINPEFKDAHFNLANLYRGIADADNANLAYQQSIRLNPSDEDHYISVIFAYNEAVRLFPNESKFKEGRARVFQQFVDFVNERRPRATAFFNLGVLFADAGEIERAVSAYQMALSIMPNHVNSLYNLGKIYLSSGQAQEAVKTFEKITKIDKNHSDAWLNIGVINNKLGRIDEAERFYLRAIAADPKNGRAYFNLAFIYEKAQKIEQAVEFYQKSIAADHENPESYYNLGNVYVLREKLKEAFPLYVKAVELNPNHLNAWVNLSVVAYRLGDFKNAVRFCDEAILLGYVPEKEYSRVLEPYRTGN